MIFLPIFVTYSLIGWLCLMFHSMFIHVRSVLYYSHMEHCVAKLIPVFGVSTLLYEVVIDISEP